MLTPFAAIYLVLVIAFIIFTYVNVVIPTITYIFRDRKRARVQKAYDIIKAHEAA
jgi:hypothetical protein